MGAVATPLASVVTVAVVALPGKVPLATDAGAVNVTCTPLKGLVPASLTVAFSWSANAALVWACCGVPPVAVIEAGAAPRERLTVTAGASEPAAAPLLPMFVH